MEHLFGQHVIMTECDGRKRIDAEKTLDKITMHARSGGRFPGVKNDPKSWILGLISIISILDTDLAFTVAPRLKDITECLYHTYANTKYLLKVSS